MRTNKTAKRRSYWLRNNLRRVTINWRLTAIHHLASYSFSIKGDMTMPKCMVVRNLELSL